MSIGDLLVRACPYLAVAVYLFVGVHPAEPVTGGKAMAALFVFCWAKLLVWAFYGKAKP